MDNYLAPHTKSSVMTGIYKYQDFVRTRQQLQAGENPLGESDATPKLKSLPIEIHGSNTADRRHHQPFFHEQASQLNQQSTLNKQFSAQQKPYSISNKNYVQLQSHQHSNSVKSPKIAKNCDTDPENQSLELVGGGSTQATSTNQHLSMSQQNAGGVNGQNIKLMSRSHLTSAHQAAKQDSFISAKPESVNSGDFVSWQIGHHSHGNPNARTTKPIQHEFILEGQSPSIPIDSRSDKLGQRTHQNRIVKLNQSAFRDQSATYNKAKSPTQMLSKEQRIIDTNATEFSMQAKTTGNVNLAGQINLYQGSQHHPVYQTIAKIGENNLLSGNLSKIKNQFVQKSGHIISPTLVKDGERQTNNISVYQSEAFNSKHRDVQNYSGNSHYTQLNNKVATLKQNSSGLIQQTNNGGVPVFIQRSQATWHSSSNPPYTNAVVAGIAASTIASETQNLAKSGQACLLPQILNQKDGGPQIQSVLEANRPTPIQAQIKKMNVEQHVRDFPEYFNLQQDPSAQAPGNSDSHKIGMANPLGSLQVNGTVSSSATFQKNQDSNYNNQDILVQQNRNGSGRKNVPSGNALVWQTASTSRKQISSKIQSALESGQNNFQHQQKGIEHFDHSGAYEINGKSGGANAIYHMAVKSAAAAVGPGSRTDSNLIQLSVTEDASKMQNTEDIAGVNKKSSNRGVPNAATSGRQPEYLKEQKNRDIRSNSAKWKTTNVKNHGGQTISHISPQLSSQAQKPTQDANSRLKGPEDQITIDNSIASGTFSKNTGDLAPFKLQLQEQQLFQDENSPTGQKTNYDIPPGLQFTYDLGDQPEEEEDESNNTDGEEGEEEQDDILIVEGDDEDLDDEDDESESPNLRGRSANNLRPSSNRSSEEKDNVPGLGFVQTNKSLNASQEDMQVQSRLYGGDIYLLGGSHFLMQDQVKKDGDYINKFSQASTTAESEMLQKRGSLKRQSSSMKNRAGGRGRKRANTKNSKHLQKIQERNSDLEAGGEENTIQATGQTEQDQQRPESIKTLQIGAGSKIDTANMTEKQKKNALRDEFLHRPPNQIVTMIKSPFPSREPYIFFPYPPFIGQQRVLPSDHSRIVQYTQEQLKPYCTPGFRVLSSTHTYNCVVNALKMAGFRHVTGSAWNVIWSGLFRQGRLRNMNSHQHINHFAGSWCLGRKDYLWRNVQRMRRLHGKAYDIAPPTYIFPEDYKRWIMDREASNFKNMYIMKPNASSCGRGIKVIGKKQTVNKRSNYVVSKYVSKPHLIRGYKYDLRLYVLVTGFDPVKIYLFKDGLVRLATVQYSTAKSSLKQRFVHLTNYSVNKKADTYIKNTNSPNKTQSAGQDEDQEEAKVESKLSFAQLRKEYKKMGVDYNEVFNNIKDLIIKTVFAAEQPILQCMGGNKNKNACFEVYGFDVLVDANLRPWLLEVNVSPSLSSSSPLDKQIKTTLLSDTLYLIGFRLLDRKQQEQEKAKQNKQRLLGFESTKAKMQNVQNDQNFSEVQTPITTTSKEPKSGGFRSRQILSSNVVGQLPQNGELNAFVSNESQEKPDKENLGITSSTAHLTLSQQKSSSPNRRRTTVSKIQPPKPWLKDFGEPTLAKGAPGGQSNNSGAFGHLQDGFVNLNECDLEMLADFEEEQQRRGNYELLFPTQKNIESFRGFISSNRRANLVLWAYIKQGAPMHHLVNQFKYMQQQSQSLQQQANNNNAPM